MDYRQYLLISFLLFGMAYGSTVTAQMPPPGYERELKLREELNRRPVMDRDSVTLIDTSMVFDPVTYQSEVVITQTRFSLRDYCKNMLGMAEPDKLLDGKPHTIIDPRTFDDLIIRYNSAQGKIDTLSKN